MHSDELSFAMPFTFAVLFLMVKASRPMTYKHLTVEMIDSIGENGIINQTLFKTNEKYGFNSLLFFAVVLTLVTGYMNYRRPRLNPVCNYLLVCQNGKQNFLWSHCLRGNWKIYQKTRNTLQKLLK